MLGPGKKGQSKGVRRSQQREEVLQLEADLVKPDKAHSTQQLSVRFECAKLRCPRGCVYAGIQVYLHVFLPCRGLNRMHLLMEKQRNRGLLQTSIRLILGFTGLRCLCLQGFRPPWARPEISSQDTTSLPESEK